MLRGVFWQHGRRRTPDADGTTQGEVLLLVVPETAARYGVDYTLESGDRLCPGEGPEISWADWADFVPGARRDVAVIQYVLPMYRGVELHHLEAGTLVDRQRHRRPQPDQLRRNHERICFAGAAGLFWPVPLPCPT